MERKMVNPQFSPFSSLFSLFSLFLLINSLTFISLPLASAGLLDSLSERFGLTSTSNLFPQSPKQLVKVQHLNNVSVVDHMVPGLPKVRMGHRVVDLFNGWHFDDILMDAPDSVRPASVVIFYDSSNEKCMKDYMELNWDKIAQKELPARSQIFTARYDMFSAPKRAWYEFTPEMDLEKRFAVKSCPEVVFVSRKCNGFTEWCHRGKDEEDERLNVLGCEDYKEQCTDDLRSVWDGEGKLSDWIKLNLKKESKPKLSRFLGSYFEQGRWLQKREHTTCNTHFRNVYMSQAFPAFTKRGFKAMETPKEMQDWLLDFAEKYQKTRRTEYWNAESTQMSFHEKPTTFMDMDLVRAKKEEMANKYLKPLLEEWTGMKPLELTSFYGMREYHEGAWLRQHLDRIDTHVLSVTLSVAKKNFTFDKDGKHDYHPWPLQVTDWTGKQVAYDHPGGTMILYESSKLPHGRNTRNNGGIHLGCFCHFKPVNMHGSDAEKWSEITSKARKNVQDHMQNARFIASPEIEPPADEIEYAENVGDGSAWSKQSDIKKKSKAEKKEPDGFTVELKNGSERPLQIFWESPLDSKPVAQGTAAAGTGFRLNTFHGHRFFWAEMGSEKPLPGGKFQVDVGKKRYEYKFTSEGEINQREL